MDQSVKKHFDGDKCYYDGACDSGVDKEDAGGDTFRIAQ